MSGRSRRRFTALVVAAITFGLAPQAAVAGPDVGGRAEDDSYLMTAQEGLAAERRTAGTPAEVRLDEFERRPECDPELPQRAGAGVCFPGTAAELAARICDGSQPVEPLWRRHRASPASPWGPWRNVVGWTCPQDYLPAFTAEDFRRLPLDPPTLTVQPDRAEHLVNMPTIVYTAPAVQLLTTDLLGYPVEVEATPTAYTWDFGDGAVLTTTSPGRPYPHHDVAHPYAQPGSYAITLTVTLAGRYRLAGATTWQPVTGTATTTTTSAPITVVEAPTRLVVGDCRTHPQDC